ncbi:lytic transglycosylase domain-containing protein [Kineosporia sp. J2-2]|uniref:Lytic transglycosylase domain-containing protein n=1 Tax=Kineosporia corallincola TaxID=2835133 RepID=A0ABS5TMT0_9ACTN|nr:lytic transglycosylase domain-containing protein [Kineosporia corallincola]MBT0772387.1 lytic transglycosylase domain-containing protein [Kineosporia corallincola]
MRGTRPGARRSRGRAGLLLLLAFLTVPLLPAEGAGNGVGTMPAASSLLVAVTTADADRAEDRARRARDRVDRLMDAYTTAEDAVAQGLSRLSGAFAAAGAAEREAARLEAARRAVAARRVRDIRAVYASGGATGLTATLLGARSPSEVLRWQGTNRRIMEEVLGSSHRLLRDARDGARLAVRRAAEAGRAADERAAAMTGLHADADRAHDALVSAETTLDRLDREARRARAAQEARDRIERERRRAGERRREAAGAVTALGIPQEYESAYREAAPTCPGLSWTLLAAVGQVESGHGRDPGPSSAGALGPMQFMPATFAAYGVDGDLDGVRDVWDPQDAIFSAARYLCASGAGTDVRRALYAYNHADWYVDLVLAAERAIVAHPAASG